MYDCTVLVGDEFWELRCATLDGIREWLNIVTGGVRLFAECDYGTDDGRAGRMLLSGDSTVCASIEESKGVES